VDGKDGLENFCEEQDFKFWLCTDPPKLGAGAKCHEGIHTEIVPDSSFQCFLNGTRPKSEFIEFLLNES
jgi:hypothetical protein